MKNPYLTPVIASLFASGAIIGGTMAVDWLLDQKAWPGMTTSEKQQFSLMGAAVLGATGAFAASEFAGTSPGSGGRSLATLVFGATPLLFAAGLAGALPGEQRGLPYAIAAGSFGAAVMLKSVADTKKAEGTFKASAFAPGGSSAVLGWYARRLS